jgi:hypothetical protein
MPTTPSTPRQDRTRLPNRRLNLPFGFECNNLKYTATVSWFDIIASESAS